MTPLELVSAYAPFANGGVGVQPHVIAKVKTAAGKQLYARKGTSLGRVIDPHYVAMMNEMMQETLLTGTARKAELPGWQAAGKTGTSQDFRDAWFVGYTSRLVAGVWLGNDDNSPTKKASGGNLPVEVWSRFMKAAHQGVPAAPLPTGPPRPAQEPEPNAVLQPFDALIGMFTASPSPPPRPRAAANPRSAPARAPRERGARNEPDEEAPEAPPPRAIEDFLPPEDIPPPGAKRRAAPRQNAGDDKNLLEKLFGG